MVIIRQIAKNVPPEFMFLYVERVSRTYCNESDHLSKNKNGRKILQLHTDKEIKRIDHGT